MHCTNYSLSYKISWIVPLNKIAATDKRRKFWGQCCQCIAMQVWGLLRCSSVAECFKSLLGGYPQPLFSQSCFSAKVTTWAICTLLANGSWLSILDNNDVGSLLLKGWTCFKCHKNILLLICWLFHMTLYSHNLKGDCWWSLDIQIVLFT